MAVEQELPEAMRAGWEASLHLEFAASGERTLLARRSSVGPLVVQRPFYPEGGVCHIYIVHPPGGVVGGDKLHLQVRAAPASHALITTPAATKFYRSDGRIASQHQEILADAATVEWLPQETILFPNAHARVTTCVRLSKGARFIGWEITCYGRPASGLGFAEGLAMQDVELWVDGAPVLLEHLRLAGRSEAMDAQCGLAGRPVLGTLLAYPAEDAMLQAARAVTVPNVISACTRVDGALVCRAAGAQADAVRALFAQVWGVIRPMVTGREAVPPRIWAT
jgi:urease accessory protein